jgi:hypothetical protein
MDKTQSKIELRCRHGFVTYKPCNRTGWELKLSQQDSPSTPCGAAHVATIIVAGYRSQTPGRSYQVAGDRQSWLRKSHVSLFSSLRLMSRFNLEVELAAVNMTAATAETYHLAGSGGHCWCCHDKSRS